MTREKCARVSLMTCFRVRLSTYVFATHAPSQRSNFKATRIALTPREAARIRRHQTTLLLLFSQNRALLHVSSSILPTCRCRSRTCRSRAAVSCHSCTAVSAADSMVPADIAPWYMTSSVSFYFGSSASTSHSRISRS